MRHCSAFEVSAWKICGSFRNISMIIVAVQPEETANHMLSVRLILVCSRLSVPTISGRKRGHFLVLQSHIWVTSSSEIPRELMTRRALSCGAEFPSHLHHSSTLLPLTRGQWEAFPRWESVHPPLLMLPLPPSESFKCGFSVFSHAAGRRKMLRGSLCSCLHLCCVCMSLSPPP